jgi:hypothetical protein
MKQHVLKLSIPPKLKAAVLCVALLLIFAVVAVGGCNNSSTNPSPSPTPAPSISATTGPSPSPTATANAIVVMDYKGGSVPPTIDPTYGSLTGYQQVTPPLPSPLPSVQSGTVTVHCNQYIQFYNVDTFNFHTASLLGNSGFPPTFNNINGASSSSPKFTAITTPEFSTGLLPAGTLSASLLYTTGPVAGTFYFGDYTFYTPPLRTQTSMRTVVTVLCP